MRILVIARVTILFYYLSLTAFGGVLNTYVDSTRATSKLPSGFFNGENMKKILLNTVSAKSPNYKKYSALVDDEDYERVNQYRWSICKKKNTNYALSRINGKSTSMHIFITGLRGIDHKNRNGLDNRKKNLRKATTQQNNANQLPRKGTSRFKGVCWDRKNNKWIATISLNGISKTLGYFTDEVKAAKTYNQKAKEFHGEFAYLNKFSRHNH